MLFSAGHLIFTERVNPVESTYPVIKKWSVDLSTVSAYIRLFILLDAVH